MEDILFHHWLVQHPNIGFFVTIFSVLALFASLFSKDFRTFMVVQWFTFAIESAKALVRGIAKAIGWVLFVIFKGFKITMVFLFTSVGRIAADHRQIKKIQHAKNNADKDNPLS